MSKLHDLFMKKRNVIEVLTEYIPGYKGYKDRERRRDADKMLREYVANRLRENREDLDKIKEDLAEKGSLEELDVIDKISRKFEKVTDKVIYSDYGNTGFFDVIKIFEEELEKIYDYDYNMLKFSEEIKEMIQKLEVEFNSDNLETLAEMMDDLNRYIDKREEIIINVENK